MIKGVFAAITCLMMGCSPKTETLSEAEQAFEDDPSMLGIDSERWSMIIERSHEGLNLAESPGAQKLDYKSDWLLRTDRALKEDALDLVRLRNRLLAMGLLKESDARTIHWPPWIFEPPTAHETPETLDARLNWVSAEAEKLTAIGCEIGSRKSNEPLFCSVE